MYKWILATLIVFFIIDELAGCAAIPVPLPPSSSYLKNVESEIDNLVDNGVSKGEVIWELGRPLKYRESTMSYKACRKSGGMGVLVVFMYPGGGTFEEFRAEPDCFELRLNFDQNSILIGYEEIPWTSRIDVENENNILISLANEGDVLAKQLLNKPGQYAWVKTLGITDDQLETLASQGKAEAQLQLYWNNPGDEQAFKWLCRAADQGNTEARYRLGLLYENGSGGAPKDPIDAYMWYRLSAHTGNYMRASDQAKRLYAKMTIEQKRQAERRLFEWNPGKCERDYEYGNAEYINQ